MGVASLVIGIVALIFSLIPLLGALAIYLAIPGVLLGIGKLLRKNNERGLAIAGLVLCLIAGVVSFLQYQVSKAVDQSMQRADQRLEESRKAFESKTGIILDKKPTADVNVKTATEPLKLNNLYLFHNDEAQVQVIELENLTEKTVAVFRGDIVQYDDFGKIAKRRQVTYRQKIDPKAKIVIAEVSDGRQSQILVAESISALARLLPLPYGKLKVPNEVKFECSDIKYAE